uniref:Fanconi-associated nuclease n=1 Tax=Photinus pyralis TaxID=7054 RepID=A0A1Y1MQT1_PHOPY
MPRQYFSADPSKPKQTLISNYFVCSSRIQILGQNKGKKKGGSMKKMSNNNEDETVTIPFKIPCYETESDDDDFRSDSGKSQHRKWRSILSASSEDKTVARKSPSKPSPSKGIVRKRSRVRPIIETDSSSDVELVSYTVNETLSSLDVTIASGSDLAEDCHNKENQKVADIPKNIPKMSIGVYSPLKKNSPEKLDESLTNESADLVVLPSDESTIIIDQNVDIPTPQCVQNKPLISVKHISTLSNCQLSPIRNPGKKNWQASTSTINTSSPCTVLVSKSTIEYNEETDNPISLNIILEIINFVVNHERLQKLLVYKDTVMLHNFLQLNSKYIFFCLKLYTRIKKWYNIFDLRTAIKSELSDPEVMAMYDCLKGSLFVDTDYSTEPIHDLLHHLHVKILRELCVEFKIPFSKVKKTDLVDKLLNNCNNQTTLTIKSSIRDLLMNSLKKKMGFCMKLNEYFFKLLNKVHLLYMFTTNEYIQTSDLYLFMSRLMDGSIVLPSYLVDRNVDIFRSIEEFNSFHEAFQCYASVLIAADKKDSALIYQLACKIYEELKKIVERNVVDNRPSYLHRFTPGHKYTKALWHAIPFVIKPHKELACEWLKFLLDQRLFCQYLRGAWFIQLTIIQTKHLKKYDEVTKTLIDSLQDTSLRNIHRMELNKRAEKIKHNKTYKISQIDFGTISSVQPLPIKNLPYREIDAQAFRR